MVNEALEAGIWVTDGWGGHTWFGDGSNVMETVSVIFYTVFVCDNDCEQLGSSSSSPMLKLEFLVRYYHSILKS